MYMADIGLALSYFPVFYKKVTLSRGILATVTGSLAVIVWSWIVFGLSRIRVRVRVAALSTITVDWGQDIV